MYYKNKLLFNNNINQIIVKQLLDMGRPKKEPTILTCVRTTQEMKDVWVECATKENLSLSEWVLNTIDKGINNNNNSLIDENKKLREDIDFWKTRLVYLCFTINEIYIGDIKNTMDIVNDIKKILNNGDNDNICPKCNTNNDKKSRYCSSCGYPLTIDGIESKLKEDQNLFKDERVRASMPKIILEKYLNESFESIPDDKKILSREILDKIKIVETDD